MASQPMAPQGAIATFVANPTYLLIVDRIHSRMTRFMSGPDPGATHRFAAVHNGFGGWPTSRRPGHSLRFLR
jgi:hypothetical protein